MCRRLSPCGTRFFSSIFRSKPEYLSAQASSGKGDCKPNLKIFASICREVCKFFSSHVRAFNLCKCFLIYVIKSRKLCVYQQNLRLFCIYIFSNIRSVPLILHSPACIASEYHSFPFSFFVIVFFQNFSLFLKVLSSRNSKWSISLFCPPLFRSIDD